MHSSHLVILQLSNVVEFIWNKWIQNAFIKYINLLLRGTLLDQGPRHTRTPSMWDIDTMNSEYICLQQIFVFHYKIWALTRIQEKHQSQRNNSCGLWKLSNQTSSSSRWGSKSVNKTYCLCVCVLTSWHLIQVTLCCQGKHLIWFRDLFFYFSNTVLK